MKLSMLKLNKNNPRFIKDNKFVKLKKSIEDFPAMMKLRPIIIDNENIILGGNMRFRALKELGYKDIPDDWIKCADELTEDEKKRFIVSDNIGYGEWDFEILGNEFEMDDLLAFGFEEKELLGFKEEEKKEEIKEPKIITCPNCGEEF